MTSGLETRWLGVGLRPRHLQYWRSCRSPVTLEVVYDNFIGVGGGKQFDGLVELSQKTQISLHSLNLNLGGSRPIDRYYLRGLKAFARRIGCKTISDHLCLTHALDRPLFGLYPIPFDDAMLDYCCQRVDEVQDFLDRPIMLENIAYYLSYKDSHYGDFEFLDLLCTRTGCGVLLDITNLFVNSLNFAFDPYKRVSELGRSHVWSYHLSGHTFDEDGLAIDSHAASPCQGVLDLFEYCLSHFGKRVTILERDDDCDIEVLLRDRALCLRSIRTGEDHAQTDRAGAEAIRNGQGIETPTSSV